MKTPPREQLEADHKELMEQFLPTLSSYQKMAARCLELQIALYREGLQEAFPQARTRTLSLVCTVTGRQSPPEFKEVLAKLDQHKIKVDHVIYDDRTFTYYLFSKGEGAK